MLADLTKSPATAAVYAALAEFERLAALLPLAPGLADRMAVAEVIAKRHERYRDLLARVGSVEGERGGMTAVAAPIDDARRRVESTDWWEALATVALSTPLTDELFELLLDEQSDSDASAGDGGSAANAGEDAGPAADDDAGGGAAADAGGTDPAAWAMRRLQAALDEDPVLSARVAMWGRRLLGEAIVLAREFGGERYPGLADRLAANHARRLGELGLAD